MLADFTDCLVIYLVHISLEELNFIMGYCGLVVNWLASLETPNIAKEHDGLTALKSDSAK